MENKILIEKFIEKNIYYVYVYLDPRKPGKYVYREYSFDYEPFYIGKGQENRLFGHLFPSNLKHNSYKNNKIKKIIQETKDNPKIEIIKNDLFEKEALSLEIKLVALIGRKDLNKGPLANLTDAGDGGGSNPSPETRKKIGDKNRGKTPRKGAVLSEETKDKIRQKHIGMTASQETRKKISDAGFKRKHSEETKNKMSINNARFNKGKIYDSQRIEEMSKKANKKPILQYDKNNVFISEFISIKEASQKTNIHKDSIAKCCNKRQKSAGNYIWKFKLESDEAVKNKNAKNTKQPVSQYTMDMIFINEYASISDAVKCTNGHRSHISDCCKGKARSSGGFIWKHKITNLKQEIIFQPSSYI